ncbi:MAG: hypothetical protein HZA36_03320, partial [Parcubacteria group bacterium]|nr:hypothetical protein [Parcubacteria group bacterium]
MDTNKSSQFQEQDQSPGSRLVVCIDDKKGGKPTLTLENPSEKNLQELNSNGYGIFETANSFFATSEQIRLLSKKLRKSITKRQTEFLSQLNEVYIDAD